jgi:hypothetical protein
MEVGDILKITEKVAHTKAAKERVTTGKIIAINKYTITIKEIKNGQETHNTNFSIGDFRDKTKRFKIKEGNRWKNIKIKVTEY